MANLTPAETEVMQILWEHGELKPAEIEEKYHQPIKNAALRFQLRVLLEKGHVSRRKVGKAFYYRAVTPREGAFQKMARRMAEIFCRGSAVGLVAELIKSEKFTPEEIRELQALAAAKSAEAVQGQKKKK